MARRRVPGVRRRPGPAHLLLSRPWVRAPLAAFGQPGASAAVLVATAVLGIAAATAPLFLSEAASGALHRAVATCPDSYVPGVTNQSADSDDPTEGVLPEPAASYAVTEDGAVRQALAAHRVPFGERTLVLPARRSDGFVTVGAGELSVTAFASPSALSKVTVLRGHPGDRGLWLPDKLATRLGLDAGDTVTARGKPEPVAGVYRDLNDPSYRGSLPVAWCRWAGLIVPPVGDSGPPVRPLVLTDDRTLLALAQNDRPWATWSAAIDPATVRAADAAAVAAAVPGAGPDVFQTVGLVGAYVDVDTLAGAAARAVQVRGALAAATRPAAYAAVLVALGLVAAAGGYWAERRAGEVRLLAARGVGPPGLAGKAVLEMIGPAVAGALLGWAATLAAAPHLGPSRLLDDGAGTRALLTVAVALVAGLLALGAVAGVRGRSTGERPIGLGRSRWGLVPWELLLVGAAVWAYTRLRESGAVSSGGESVRISPLLVALPLLALAGLTVLVVRLAGLPAAGLQRLGGRLPVPGFLAVRRLTAARAVSAGLLVAVALPVGVLVVCASLSASVQTTVDTKTATYVGAPVALRTDATPGVYAAPGSAGTPVSLLPEALDEFSQELPVLAVDPATFARYAFWRGDFATRSLPDLLSRLGPAQGGRVPAILAGGGDPNLDHVQLETLVLPVHVVARATAFPGMRSVAAPLLVVDRHALPTLGPYTARSEEVWTRPADAGAAARAIGTQGLHVTGQVNQDSIVRSTDLFPLTWTFGYVQALAALAGVIGVTALLLYLAARQRSRTAAYALSRRMGLTRRAHLASLLVELAVAVGLGAVAGVALARLVLVPMVRVLNLEPGRPPYPAVLVVSAGAVLAVAVAAVALVLLGTLATQVVADRARPADVLRGAE
jgi:putative ABC transport system permease protein